MAIKKFKVKAGASGVHSLTGIALVPGETHELEESLAGAEIFEPMGEEHKKNKKEKEV